MRGSGQPPPSPPTVIPYGMVCLSYKSNNKKFSKLLTMFSFGFTQIVISPGFILMATSDIWWLMKIIFFSKSSLCFAMTTFVPSLILCSIWGSLCNVFFLSSVLLDNSLILQGFCTYVQYVSRIGVFANGDVHTL